MKFLPPSLEASRRALEPPHTCILCFSASLAALGLACPGLLSSCPPTVCVPRLARHGPSCGHSCLGQLSQPQRPTPPQPARSPLSQCPPCQGKGRSPFLGSPAWSLHQGLRLAQGSRRPLPATFPVGDPFVLRMGVSGQLSPPLPTLNHPQLWCLWAVSQVQPLVTAPVTPAAFSLACSLSMGCPLWQPEGLCDRSLLPLPQPAVAMLSVPFESEPGYRGAPLTPPVPPIPCTQALPECRTHLTRPLSPPPAPFRLHLLVEAT